MLAELQHVQKLISRLTEQLDSKQLENLELQEQVCLQTVNPKDEAARTELQHKVDQLEALLIQSDQEKSELAERLQTLELAHIELSKSHSQAQQNIAALEKSKLSLDQQVALIDETKIQLEVERDALLRKNDFAKQKVEAIIHRLSMLGQNATTDANL
jgi:chromosome segregation ATPase